MNNRTFSLDVESSVVSWLKFPTYTIHSPRIKIASPVKQSGIQRYDLVGGTANTADTISVLPPRY